MYSVKEMAETLQLSKIMVYRFINDNEIKHSSKDGRTFLYDVTAFQKISDGLKDKKLISNENNNEITDNKKKEEPHDVEVQSMTIEILKSEIDNKNKQIDDLTEINKSLSKSLQQQQTLLLNEQQKNANLIEKNSRKKKWYKWWS